MGDLLDYRATLSRNREAFLLNQSTAVDTFRIIDSCFDKMTDSIRVAKTPEGKTHVSLLPMLALMQRQFRAAFQSISSYQAYEAWLLLRPAIEIPLIVGKWLDDRKYVKIWRARATNKKQYRQSFSGEALRSQSIRDSDRIQIALARLNDLFVHPNPEYCDRHLNLDRVGVDDVVLSIEYFDDSRRVMAAWIAMSHLMVFVQDRLWRAIASQLVGVKTEYAGLEKFETAYREIAAQLSDESAETKQILTQIGLWNL